jgi:hypothetical protein
MTTENMNQTVSPNNWFDASPVYEGWGRAEFEEPSGIVEGPTSITFNERGDSTAHMVIESLHSERELEFGSMEFFSTEKPVKEAGAVTLPQTFGNNRCLKLTVKTSEGEFSSSEGIHYNKNIVLVGPQPNTIDFHLLRSEFRDNNTEPAKYWVFPLANFISKFRQRHAELDQHPLRIHPTPPVRPTTSDREAIIEFHRANAKNHLIGFEFNQGLGFIEARADYQTGEQNLLDGKEGYAITALMVGDVNRKSIEDDQLDSWLPSEFLRLLGLASGNVVSAPWIEFRDQRGLLVKRIHKTFEGAVFSRGRSAIKEDMHTGAGYLLTRYVACPERGQAYLRVALKHLNDAGLDSNSIEESFIYLCRALEGICERYGTRTQNLLDGVDANVQLKVKQALQTAAKLIKSEASTAAATHQHEQSRNLNRIAERVSNSANRDSDFGLAVCALLKQFNLPDADIIDAYYAANPRSDGRKSWSSVLSYYRGAPTHTGFFNFSGKEHDADDIIIIMEHLRDVLLRIIFQIAGYDGTYQPPLVSWVIDAKHDWVKANTPAAKLGFK